MENNGKKLPKCRAIKNNFKLSGTILHCETFFSNKIDNYVSTFMDDTLRGKHIYSLEKEFAEFFKWNAMLSHLTSKELYQEKAVQLLHASNQLFELRVQRWTSAKGSVIETTIPVPAYLPRFDDELYNLRLEVSNEDSLKMQWNNWIEMVCYAISIRSEQALERLLGYTEEQAWRAEKAYKGRDFHEQHPMFLVRYLKAVLMGSPHCDLLYQQLVEVYAPKLYAGWMTLLEPFYFIQKGDEKGYVDAMYRASMAHKAMLKARDGHVYSKGQMDFFNPYLLGAAVRAFEVHGWEPIPNNDYLYPWWILNDFTSPLDLAFSKKESPPKKETTVKSRQRYQSSYAKEGN